MPVRHAAIGMLLAGLAFGGGALAQTEAPPPDSAAPMAQSVGPAAANRLDKWIDGQHSRLHITAAQQAQWDNYVQILRENAAHAAQLAKLRADAAGKSAVEDLKAMAAAAQSRAADVQRLVPAFEALYTAMSPEQQKMADTAMREFARRAAGRL